MTSIQMILNQIYSSRAKKNFTVAPDHLPDPTARANTNSHAEPNRPK
jgi:hypothetical protein